MKRWLLFLIAACAASAQTHASQGYSCNNVAGFNGLDGSTAEQELKSFKNGVSYKEYSDDYGNSGVRLTGEGIGGGLCFDNVDAGKQAFALKSDWGLSCNNIKPIGTRVNSVGTYPSVTLAKIEVEGETDNYGIRLSGQGIGGGLCFEKVDEAFSYLEFMKQHKSSNYKAKGKFMNDDARISGRNGYIKISGNGVGGKFLVIWDH